MKRHWYKWHEEECPLCGSGKSWKERVYGTKPKDASKRYQYEHIYDYCDV